MTDLRIQTKPHCIEMYPKLDDQCRELIHEADVNGICSLSDGESVSVTVFTFRQEISEDEILFEANKIASAVGSYCTNVTINAAEELRNQSRTRSHHRPHNWLSRLKLAI